MNTNENKIKKSESEKNCKCDKGNVILQTQYQIYFKCDDGSLLLRSFTNTDTLTDIPQNFSRSKAEECNIYLSPLFPKIKYDKNNIFSYYLCPFHPLCSFSSFVNYIHDLNNNDGNSHYSNVDDLSAFTDEVSDDEDILDVAQAPIIEKVFLLSIY
jgi:hypothetical protein